MTAVLDDIKRLHGVVRDEEHEGGWTRLIPIVADETGYGMMTKMVAEDRRRYALEEARIFNLL